jgi:hypothetical protein
MQRLSELCCLAVTQLLLLGKSVISKSGNKAKDEADEEDVKIEWPEDLVSKAKIIRLKAQFMSSDVLKVSASFITGTGPISNLIIYFKCPPVIFSLLSEMCSFPGISDIIEAYIANQHPEQKALQTKANEISDQLRSDETNALSKIQDALHHLAFVVLSTSMPTA